MSLFNKTGYRLEIRRYGYSFQLLDDWKEVKSIYFWLRHMRHFESSDKKANIELVVENDWPRVFANKVERASSLLNYTALEKLFINRNDFVERLDLLLSEEENTLHYRFSGEDGCARVISSIHDGKHYIIRSLYSPRHEQVINGMIGSFKFEFN